MKMLLKQQASAYSELARQGEHRAGEDSAQYGGESAAAWHDSSCVSSHSTSPGSGPPVCSPLDSRDAGAPCPLNGRSTDVEGFQPSSESFGSGWGAAPAPGSTVMDSRKRRLDDAFGRALAEMDGCLGGNGREHAMLISPAKQPRLSLQSLPPNNGAVGDSEKEWYM